MSLTPQLLKCMTPDHALAALRCEMPDEFMPLLDQIEALYPGANGVELLGAWDGRHTAAEDMEGLASAVTEAGGVEKAAALLLVLARHPRERDPDELDDALALATRLEKAGITDIGDLDTLLAAVEAIQRVAP